MALLTFPLFLPLFPLTCCQDEEPCLSFFCSLAVISLRITWARSPKGSETRMGLASLFGTWMAQGLNPFHRCLALGVLLF